MKISFFLDVKLIESNGEYYTTGAADYTYFENFKVNHDDEIIVFCRKTKTNTMNKKITMASGNNMKVVSIGSFRDLLKKNNRKKMTDVVTGTELHIIKQPSIIGSYACHVMNRNKIKYLVNVVGCPWDAYSNSGMVGKMIAPIMFAIVRYYVKNADAVMYVTNAFLQKRYPTKGVQVGCSDVILKGNDDHVLIKRLNKIKKLKNNKKIIIGTIGAIDVKYKGQRYVIMAMKKLKKYGYDIEYQLVGDGEKEQLDRIAKKNGVGENIKYLGCMPHEKIFDWLDKIDLYIQPSEVEGLCRSILEAMSRACPIIASGVGGNFELINNEYIFKSKKVNQLIDRIMSMSKDEMTKEARDNFFESKKYSEEKINKKRRSFLKSFADLK